MVALIRCVFFLQFRLITVSAIEILMCFVQTTVSNLIGNRPYKNNPVVLVPRQACCHRFISHTASQLEQIT